MAELLTSSSESVLLSASTQNESASRPSRTSRVELRLVYRTLRLISDWALEYFYSDFYVEGVENVDERGALILSVFFSHGFCQEVSSVFTP